MQRSGRSRQKEATQGRETEAPHARPREPGSDVEDREARIATVQRVLASVGDPTLRELVQLRYGEPEHSTREIASKLSLPHGTVTNRLMRFRASIRRDLCRALAEEEVA